MSKTIVLSQESDLSFILIGISSTSKEYRIAWEINRQIGIDLQKQSDLLFYNRSSKDNQMISNLHFSNLGISYHLLSNRTWQKGSLKFLISEMKHFDYFLLLRGESLPQTNFNEEFLNKLTEIQIIQISKQIDLALIKSKDSLHFLSFI